MMDGRTMDSLAHALAGACLAKAGLERATPLATSTLILAANVPDVEAVCYLMGPDLAYGFRRGWTHGVLAMVLLPILVASAMLTFDTYVRRRLRPDAPPARPWPLLALAVVGVLSHSAMDWLNSYGVRLLMPFEPRWFYGDALYILDPWLWLLLGLGISLTWLRRRQAAVAGAVGLAALLVTLLISPQIPAPAKIAWVIGLAIVAVVRWRIPARSTRSAALTAIVLSVVYIGAMVGISRTAERHVADLARARAWPLARITALPVLADPFSRQVIAETPTDYVVFDTHFGVVSDLVPHHIDRGVYTDLIARALDARSVQGVKGWLRFPSYEVQFTRAGGQRVVIRDARFIVGSLPGFGVVGIVDYPKPEPYLAPR
jgi:inner membrane protein